jgi:hypothetical protein
VFWGWYFFYCFGEGLTSDSHVRRIDLEHGIWALGAHFGVSSEEREEERFDSAFVYGGQGNLSLTYICLG